jgi:hypothetical protein
MKVYDIVKNCLEVYPRTRNSDKVLIFRVWEIQGIFRSHGSSSFRVYRDDFITRAISSESITRARRKIQERHEELRADEPVEKARRKKQATKGTFIYRERS